jgi:hypothetical protein
LGLETLEVREVPAGIVTGTGPGTPALVRVFADSLTQPQLELAPFGTNFTGGVRVATAFQADDRTDVLAVAGPGGPAEIRRFHGTTGAALSSITAFPATLTAGLFVATGDVNGDGTADVVVAPDQGGGPHVKVFDGHSGQELASFMAYASTFTGGVRVAVGDVTGDGVAEIITAAGPNGGPHVKVFTLGGQVLASFMAYDATFTGGVRVAAGDLDGDGVAEIVTGPDVGGGPHVKIFAGSTGVEQASFMAGPTAPQQGARVAAADWTHDGRAEVVVGSGPSSTPTVSVYEGPTGALVTTALAPANEPGGFMVAALTSAPYAVLTVDPSVTTLPADAVLTLDIDTQLVIPDPSDPDLGQDPYEIEPGGLSVDWGDGTPVTVWPKDDRAGTDVMWMPDHTFTTPGTYTVTVIVVYDNDDGGYTPSATVTRTITVTAPVPTEPTATLTVVPPNPPVLVGTPISVLIDTTLTIPNPSDPNLGLDPYTITELSIDWGDGTPVEVYPDPTGTYPVQWTPTHIFTTVGTYPVIVRVEYDNDDGAYVPTTIVTDTLVVTATPTVQIDLTPSAGTIPTDTPVEVLIDTAVFIPDPTDPGLGLDPFEIVGGVTIDWGDGTLPEVITDPTPGTTPVTIFVPHIYTIPGTYTVTVSVDYDNDDGVYEPEADEEITVVVEAPPEETTPDDEAECPDTDATQGTPAPHRTHQPSILPTQCATTMGR